jgi:hypothetical protein
VEGGVEMDLGLGFPCLSLGFLQNSPLCVLCKLVFIGEMWHDHKHISPSTYFFFNFDFLIFCIFKKKLTISTSTQ